MSFVFLMGCFCILLLPRSQGYNLMSAPFYIYLPAQYFTQDVDKTRSWLETCTYYLLFFKKKIMQHIEEFWRIWKLVILFYITVKGIQWLLFLDSALEKCGYLFPPYGKLPWPTSLSYHHCLSTGLLFHIQMVSWLLPTCLVNGVTGNRVQSWTWILFSLLSRKDGCFTITSVSPWQQLLNKTSSRATLFPWDTEGKRSSVAILHSTHLISLTKRKLSREGTEISLSVIKPTFRPPH